ncbi:MAG: NADH-quinone oxidoreductase subunit NuoE [Firmicutes bacterium]|nr:NADH-quinone oxidoreductase subunit NuoE [Bacillota bacterium]
MGCACARDHATDERYERLEAALKEWAGRPGALIPALHRAQQIFGYLPEDVMIRIAEALDVRLAEVYGVATFYSFFSLKPRGKYTIGLCLGTACYVNGAAEVLAALEEALAIRPGETTKDGLFSLSVTRCLGACGLAPVMTVGEEVYGRLTPAKIPGILARYREKEA